MVYLKCVACDDNDESRRVAARKVRDEMLSRVFGIGNAEGLVIRDNSGRPYIKNAAFDFSVAHTCKAAVVAACGEGSESEGGYICENVKIGRIGVDIERENREIAPTALKRICDRFYSEKEKKYVAAGTEGDKRRFLEVWTRKESIVKADGNGLSGISTADSFSGALKFIKTDYISVGGENYILSIAGI